MTGVAQGHKHFLTFRGTATDSESPLHFTFIHAILLSPEMFTRPREDSNDSLFVLRPWCNAIRVRTPPALQCTCASLCFHINCMKPLWKVVLASVICTPAESKFPFSARSSPRVTSVSSFLLKMSSSLGRQYDTADSRAAKLNSYLYNK